MRFVLPALNESRPPVFRIRLVAAVALTWIKGEVPPVGQVSPAMTHFIFKCPRTGKSAQHWQADEVMPGDAQCTYETVICQACGRLHFINRSTGKLLGEQQHEQ